MCVYLSNSLFRFVFTVTHFSWKQKIRIVITMKTKTRIFHSTEITNRETAMRKSTKYKERKSNHEWNSFKLNRFRYNMVVASFFIDIYYTEFWDEIRMYLEPQYLWTFLFYCQRINLLKWKINIASARISHLAFAHTKNVTKNIRIQCLIVNCYGFVCACVFRQ